jgi:hypothetical protein
MPRRFAVFVIVAGCGVFDAEPSVSVRIEEGDRLPPATVVFEVRNNLDRPVDVFRCGGRVLPVVEVHRTTGWEQFSGAFCTADLSSVPLTLSPGESVRDSVRFTVESRYRFRVHYGVGAESRSITSASFDIAFPPD